MNTFEVIAIAAVGVGFVAGVSFAIYSVLPRTVQTFAGTHGRYTGLGSVDELSNEPLGHRPTAPVASSLLGHSA